MRNSPLLVLSLLAIAGCDRAEPAGHEASLKRFESCDEMRDYAEQVALEMVIDSYYGYGWVLAADDAEAGADNSGGDGPSDYTTTNVQEEGVDELDMVKTDGEHIYVAQDNAVQILSSWPAEDAALLAQVPLEGWARGLFLDGDELIVLEYIWGDEYNFFESWAGTRVTWIDVSDRADPQVTRVLDLDGYLADARQIGGETYLVVNHYMYLPQGAWEVARQAWEDGRMPELDWTLEGEAFEADREAKMAEARETLAPDIAAWARDLDTDTLIPSMREDLGAVEPMYGCDDVYRPADASSYSMLSLVHLSGEGDVNPVGLMSDGWTVYASVDNLYVAQSSWWWWGRDADDVMSTDIHKFELGAGGEPEYVASGSVQGWIYDQFALSEYDGHLRVATTDVNWWWGITGEEDEEPANNVFVLEDDGAGSLDQVGELGGIAPGEQIYAVRMMGEVGYVVTYEQIDPLFTVDLSDPTAPALMGELELPGYSAYLHPFGEDKLLAVGMAGDWDGNLQGLAVSVFDVSDLANPQLAHQYTFADEGWSWSEALYDHHAFTFHRGVLSIPAYSYDYEDGGYFSGLIVLSVDAEAGIEELGRIDHRGLVERSDCLYASYYDEDYRDQCYEDYWYASVRRSVYVEDKLFSISNYGALVNELNEPEIELAEVLFYPRGE
ncbi:MAG: beta-propeller domain-containing protein [Alphaproteobacteria bacterium]|nr:beta-propeller domain-containing protein [Alphaproteobacteria bacterium]MCB9796003.1 beta-propeller domain-containing protein [Alphaproteobacteria bacterium]